MGSDFVHYDLGNLGSGDTVQVALRHRANVLLLDSSNFARYRRGDQYTYYGGEQVRSPANIGVPSAGHWHVVIDLGGAAGRIESSVEVFSSAA